VKKANTYTAMKTDLKKLEGRIAQRQKWCDEETARGDKGSAKMFEKDVKDLTTILKMITLGEYDLARDVIEWLDTAVRDEIPVRLYNFIARKDGQIVESNCPAK
jgi:hypothetical protein